MNLFTDAELQTLSAEIDQQLSELNNDSASEEGNTKHTGHTPKTVPTKQKRQLEHALMEARKTAITTGKPTLIEADEDAESLMQKIFRVGKKDLCEEGGVLHDQFEELNNLGRKSMLVIFGSVLTGMGLPPAVLSATAVAVSVIVLHIGIKAFCEDCQ